MDYSSSFVSARINRFSINGEKNGTAPHAVNIHTGYPSGTPFIDYWWPHVPIRDLSLLEVLVEPLQVMALPMYSLSAILRLPASSSRTCDGSVGLGSSLDCLFHQPVTRLSVHLVTHASDNPSRPTCSALFCRACTYTAPLL